MTQRYLGGIITANPTEPSENFSDSAASGMWTMQEALSFSKAGDWPDPASINPSKFVENIFSTFVYAGDNSTSRDISNGIDLSNKGGLVWFKERTGSQDHTLFDTERGTKRLNSNNNSAEFNDPDGLRAYNNDGFQISNGGDVNASGDDYVSWTFRKQPKFFDIVTYTGDGSSPRQISHNLGSVPGMMIIKTYDNAENWVVYHRSVDSSSPEDYALTLNSTAARADESSFFNDTAPTSSVFTVGANLNSGYGGGMNYVAYLFAHNDGDGGFGETGDQDIIKCGSYTTDSNEDATINLGFEPQWLLVKRSDSSTSGDWRIIDNIRGWETDGDAAYVEPNTSDAEAQSGDGRYYLTSTGFKQDNFGASRTYVYVAIRRGLMKAPTASTNVFAIESYTGSGSTGNRSTNILVDTILSTRPDTVNNKYFIDRIRGGEQWLRTETSEAEGTQSTAVGTFGNNFLEMLGNGATINSSSFDYTNYLFRRAPSFFDVVAYTGTGATPTNVSHNLGVTPELILVKNRSNAESWAVFNSTIGKTKQGFINTNGAFGTEDTADQAGGVWGDHTSSIIQVGTNGRVGTSSQTYVAYLFATLAGVSKVGTYSGTGSDVNVDCGFTSGARFVLAKRTDSTGSWYIWDSTNGIVSGNDPYLLLENTAAQVTNTDYIDPLSSGFTITSNAGNDLNQSSGTYVFLAIA